MPAKPKPHDTFAARLRAARERLGWSQNKLAQEADVPQGYLSQIEAGAKVPGLEIAARLARAVGVSLDELAA